MLVDIDPTQCLYTIAINNATNGSEIVSDLSLIGGRQPGKVIFAFTHMAAALVQDIRWDDQTVIPGGFGYQPMQPLLDAVGIISGYAADRPHGHKVAALLPAPNSLVGKFLNDMDLATILFSLGVEVSYDSPANDEIGTDDTTRRNLLPFKIVTAEPSPDFAVLRQLRNRVEAVFADALPHESGHASTFAGIVNEAVDNLIEYGMGGIIGGLYYPRVGEVEIALINRKGGFGGETPVEQCEALLRACEGDSRRQQGGGNGIPQLSKLAMTCFGTLSLRNGNATVRMGPDGEVAAVIEQTDLPVPGASVSILLQLVPDKSLERNDYMLVFERALRISLENHY